MSEPSTNGTGLLAGLGALLVAAAALLPKLVEALKARAEARAKARVQQLQILGERRALASYLGRMADWTGEHPALRLLLIVPEPLALVRDELIVWANYAYTDLLGFPPHALDGQPWQPRIAADSNEAVKEARRRVAAGVTLRDFRCRLIRRDGVELAIRAATSELPEVGPQTHLVWITPDPSAA